MAKTYQRSGDTVEGGHDDIPLLAIRNRGAGRRIDHLKERPPVNKMKTAAFAVAHHSLLTGRPKHRADLGSAVHIIERCAPELLHALGPFDRIAAGRDEHAFQAA